MRLSNIQMAGNEHGKLRANTIYAELVGNDGHVVISATLEYILAAIRDGKYEVDGVSVGLKDERGAVCSHVRLTRYE